MINENPLGRFHFFDPRTKMRHIGMAAKRIYSEYLSLYCYFFTEEPDKAIHWLSTIVSTDWCVTFDIPDQMLTKSRARYRDPARDNWLLDKPATIWRTEWCLQQYSIHTAHIVKADNQWAHYEENMEKELVEQLGPLGLLLLMMR